MNEIDKIVADEVFGYMPLETEAHIAAGVKTTLAIYCGNQV